MKTYTYSYQNVKSPGRLRTPANLAGYPNARTTVGAYCIRPPNGPPGPNGTYSERPVGPPDHSPGRNPGAQRHTPPQTGLRARMDERRGRVFATDGGARWGVCNTPLPRYHHSGPTGPPQQTNGPQGPQHNQNYGLKNELQEHAPRPAARRSGAGRSHRAATGGDAEVFRLP